MAALCGFAAAQPVLAAADASPETAGSAPSTLSAQCDSVSFATGTRQNRAACRRIFARQIRPTVQTSPQTAADFGS
ncbi:hypothetical protein BTH42_05605 [Burkholderia sp. SRS-W-2-2016]|nr:hypothetical protein BTH42_05605 [Burkholderia sp. SRS-W-2-2016]